MDIKSLGSICIILGIIFLFLSPFIIGVFLNNSELLSLFINLGIILFIIGAVLIFYKLIKESKEDEVKIRWNLQL